MANQPSPHALKHYFTDTYLQAPLLKTKASESLKLHAFLQVEYCRGNGY